MANAKVGAKLLDLRQTLALKETDRTWLTIDTAIQELTALYRSEPLSTSKLNHFIHEMRPTIEASILTDRTRLSGSAVALIQQVAEILGDAFLPFVEWALPALLKLPTRTNKVVVTRATNCILDITKHTKLPALIPFYFEALKSPSKFLRLAAIKAILVAIQNFPPHASLVHVQLIEASLREGAVDSTPEVREASRLTYAAYVKAFPDRRSLLDASLSEVARKYLLKPVSKPTRPGPSLNKSMARKPRLDTLGTPAKPGTSKPDSFGDQPSLRGSDSEPLPSSSSKASSPSPNPQIPLEQNTEGQPRELGGSMEDVETSAGLRSDTTMSLSFSPKLVKSPPLPLVHNPTVSAFEVFPGTL